MLHDCGVDGYLFRSMNRLYERSMGCVTLGSRELLIGRRLSEREGMMLARDRETWGRMVYRSE